MSTTKPPREKVLTNPARLSETEREYYRATWGFDPVGDCRYNKEKDLNHKVYRIHGF